MIAQLATEAWFWAFLAALGWGMGIALVGSKKLGRHLSFGIVMFILAEAPRIILPLGFVSQVRIDPNPAWVVALGVIIFGGSLVFGSPVFRIVPLTGPERSETLRTSGLYTVARHPLMLCDILWPLGWSLIFGSVIGLALVPVWIALIWLLTFVEEEALVREYGEAYRAFQARTPRLLPRLAGGWKGGKRR